MSSVSETESNTSAEGGPGRRNSEAVTQRLLASAVRVFGEKGYEAARVADIARRCSLTTGAIYGRWANKRDLFLAVIDYVMDRLKMFEVEAASMPPNERLLALGDELLASADDELRNVLLEACVVARRDPALNHEIAKALETHADAFTAVIDRAKRPGLNDEASSNHAMALNYVALYLGMTLAISLGMDNSRRPSSTDWNELMMRSLGTPQPVGS